jgi:hypothetical protein
VGIAAGGILYGDKRNSEIGKKLRTITNYFPNSVISSCKALLWYLSYLFFAYDSDYYRNIKRCKHREWFLLEKQQMEQIGLEEHFFNQRSVGGGYVLFRISPTLPRSTFST